MDFTTCLLEQLRLHPSMQPDDVIKHIHQASRGAEHLLLDANRARAYFDQEYAVTPADASQPLFEPLSEHICRMNIAAWKAAKLPADWLFRMFVHTIRAPLDSDELLNQYIAEATELIEERAIFPLDEWEAALSSWRSDWWPAVHHSGEYRVSEKPAYRIVRSQFQCILPVLRQLNSHPDTRVIAIDGRAASGKTTKAELLSAVLVAPVIHMDDFFLPPSLRTEERLSLPGGNVHHERFVEEVLPGLRSGEAFSYRIFDCSKMEFSGRRSIPVNPLRIVEGSYALHPALGDYADLRVFSSVDESEQMARILHRNGERMAEMFRSRWIPMEETYFDHFAIREKAHVCL